MQDVSVIMLKFAWGFKLLEAPPDTIAWLVICSDRGTICTMDSTY